MDSTHIDTHIHTDTKPAHIEHTCSFNKATTTRHSHSGRRSKATFIHADGREHKLKWPDPSVVFAAIL